MCNGFGISWIALRILSLSSCLDWTRICLRKVRVILENNVSIRFSHDPCLGVCTYESIGLGCKKIWPVRKSEPARRDRVPSLLNSWSRPTWGYWSGFGSKCSAVFLMAWMPGFSLIDTVMIFLSCSFLFLEEQSHNSKLIVSNLVKQWTTWS